MASVLIERNQEICLYWWIALETWFEDIYMFLVHEKYDAKWFAKHLVPELSKTTNEDNISTEWNHNKIHHKLPSISLWYSYHVSRPGKITKYLFYVLLYILRCMCNLFIIKWMLTVIIDNPISRELYILEIGFIRQEVHLK